MIRALTVWWGVWFPDVLPEGTWAGLDGLPLRLEFDYNSKGTKKAVVAIYSHFPSDNPIITGQRFFWGGGVECHMSLFPFILFLSTSSHLLLRVWRNQWGEGKPKERAWL